MELPADQAVAKRHPSIVSVVIDEDGSATVECTLAYTNVPESGIRLGFSAPGMRAVSVTQPGGTSPFVAHFRNRVAMNLERSAGSRDCDAVVKYAFDAQQYSSAYRRLFRIGTWNVPQLLLPKPPPPFDGENASPWTRPPDLVFNVTTPDRRWALLGPRYPTSANDRVTSTCAFFEGAMTGALVVGDLQPLHEDQDFAILAPYGKCAPPCGELHNEVLEVAALIERHFHAEFGPPRVTAPREFLLVQGATAPSLCLGSAIIVNVDEIVRAQSPTERRARLLAVLSHELAHAWFLYGTFWDSAASRRAFNEALAIFFEGDVARRLGGSQLAEVIEETEKWRGIRSALFIQSKPRALETAGSALGVPIYLLLEAAARDHPTATARAIRALWSAAKSRSLGVGTVRETFAHELGPDFAEAITLSLKRPLPLLVARVRLGYDHQSSQWTLRVQPHFSRLRELETRFRAARVRPDAASVDRIEFKFSDLDDLDEHYARLSPLLLVSERLRRQTLITLRPAMHRLWQWAEGQLKKSHRSTHGVRSTIRFTVAGLAAVFLNSESPVGFILLSRALRFLPALSTRLRHIAAGRATNYGENEIRAPLSAST